MGDDYSFLQEKIKDESGSPMTMKKKIIRMIVLGLIFGMAACFTFIAIYPVVTRFLGQDKEVVSIPADENVEETLEKERENKVENIKLAEDQKQMRLLKELQNNAKDTTTAIVSITGQLKIEEDTGVKQSSGVILADNGSEILVLSQTLSDKELKNVRVTFADEKNYVAKLKMKDNNIGIVVYAVDKGDLEKDTLKRMQIVKLGNSLLTESGDPIYLIGQSEKEDLQISYGFVASSEEKREIADGYIELLRVDVAGAAFNNGTLFNQNGEMTGLVKSTVSENKTLVTVLSISGIKDELERMSNGKGVPYVGIWGVTLPEKLETEELKKGIWVKEIDTDSPAMEAGIQPGDVITHMNGTAVSDMNEYRECLLKTAVKEEITLSVLRKGAEDDYVEMKFPIVIGKK